MLHLTPQKSSYFFSSRGATNIDIQKNHTYNTKNNHKISFIATCTYLQPTTRVKMIKWWPPTSIWCLEQAVKNINRYQNNVKVHETINYADPQPREEILNLIHNNIFSHTRQICERNSLTINKNLSSLTKMAQQ